MKFRILLYFFVLQFLSASSLEVNGNFDSPSLDTNLPGNWQFHEWRQYQPFPKTEYIAGENNVIKFSDINGISGMAIAYKKRFSGRPGDQVLIDLKMRGVGEAFVDLYLYYGRDGWSNTAGRKLVTLTENWKLYSFLITIPEGINRQMETFELVLGAKRGSEPEFSELKAMYLKSPYRGTIAFPEVMALFQPIDPEYKPDFEELNSIPEVFNGQKPVRAKLLDSSLDFNYYFEENKVGNCAWVFAEINSPVDSDYTIGAGADWWMCVYVNGKETINTLESGNVEGVINVKNHIKNFRLKKGKNIVAVKFLSGRASALFKIAGPNELRNLDRKLRPAKILNKLDYETSLHYPGEPLLQKGTITPQIRTLTTQAHYSCKEETSILFDVDEFNLKNLAENDFFTLGTQVQSIHEESAAAELAFDFMENGRLSAVIVYTPQKDTLNLQIRENQKIVLSEKVPLIILPAFFTASVNSKRECIFMATGVQGMTATLKTKFAEKLIDEKVQSNIKIKSLNTENAKICLDDSFRAIYSNSPKQQAPLSLGVPESFDPVKEGWKLIFADEFDGSSLDKNKWLNFREEETDHLVSVKDGYLNLTADWTEKKDKLQVPSLSSRQNFQFGYFEARVKFTSQPGWWAAFWMCTELPSNPFSTGFEIDVFEDGRTRNPIKPRIDHTLHSFYQVNTYKSWVYINQTPIDVNKFYVMGCRWTPFAITIYMDGKAVASTAHHSQHENATFDALNHVVGHSPLRVYLSGCIRRAKEGQAPDKSGNFPESFAVDYVRIYDLPRNELPQVNWGKKSDLSSTIKIGDMLTLEADVKANKKTESPIKAAFLFDNGSLIDFRSESPYIFEIPFTQSFYDTSNYAVPGVQQVAPPIYCSSHSFSIYVQDENGQVAFTEAVNKKIVSEQPSRPYQGKRAPIPGTLALPHYDEGGETCAYYKAYPLKSKSFRPDERVGSDGEFITDIWPFEWLNYSVEIKETGKYRLELNYMLMRLPKLQEQFVKLSLDHEEIGIFPISKNKTDLEKWAKSILEVELPKGKHLLTIEFQGFHCGYNPANIQSFLLK